MASTEIENLDPTATVDQINKIAADRALNRRRFISALGMAGAAAGATALMSGCSNVSTSNVAINAAGVSQTNILNFVLNLQYLEATLYSYITQGTDLPSNLTYGSGAISGNSTLIGSPLSFTAQVNDLLNEIYFDELNHVTYLQNILGSAAVPRPAINLAAFGTLSATNNQALAVGRLLEDVGVTAYAGVLPGLSSSNATYVAQTLGADSFHSGALRLLSIQSTVTTINAGDGLDVPPNDPGTTAMASAGPSANGGFFASSGGVIAPTNTNNGLAYARTTSQALAVLYGAVGKPASAGATIGGFFPSGVNGAISSV
jgi:hypothetical protein